MFNKGHILWQFLVCLYLFFELYCFNIGFQNGPESSVRWTYCQYNTSHIALIFVHIFFNQIKIQWIKYFILLKSYPIRSIIKWYFYLQEANDISVSKKEILSIMISKKGIIIKLWNYLKEGGSSKVDGNFGQSLKLLKSLQRRGRIQSSNFSPQNSYFSFVVGNMKIYLVQFVYNVFSPKSRSISHFWLFPPFERREEGRRFHQGTNGRRRLENNPGHCYCYCYC